VGSSSGESSETAADCLGECINLGPGWNGPVVVADGSTPPACTSGEEPQFEAFSDLVAPPAECTCSCGAADVECPETGDILNRGAPDAFSCVMFVSPVWQDEVGPGCNDIPNALDLSELLLQVDQPGSLAGFSCDPLETTEVPAAEWGSGWSGCTADASVGECDVCDTQIGGMCIWQEGDVDCNVPGFPVKSLLHTGFSDGRDCSDCSCGAPSGICSADVTYRSGDTCNLGNVGSGQAGDCVDVEFARGANVTFFDTFSCDASAVSPTGSVVGEGPITTCCSRT
jgi:hypothetical protein